MYIYIYIYSGPAAGRGGAAVVRQPGSSTYGDKVRIRLGLWGKGRPWALNPNPEPSTLTLTLQT